MSATIEKLDVKLEQLDPASIRYRVLFAVRQFRASWIELARVLREVLYNRDFENWGYENFEDYCRVELGLKKPTVSKLLNGYDYLREAAPERLQAYETQIDRGDFRTPLPEVPDYNTVDLLRRVRDNHEVDDEEKERFHRMAFDAPQEESFLRKEIRAAMGAPGARAGARGGDDEPAAELTNEERMAEIRRTSALLRKQLHEADFIPEGLVDRFDTLLLELEAFE